MLIVNRIDLLKIRQLVQDSKYLIKTHARKRIAERSIRECEVVQTLLRGSIVEETLDAKPYPKYLIMDFIREEEPLYVSCSTDGKMVYIITVHWYDSDKWINPWKRRR